MGKQYDDIGDYLDDHPVPYEDALAWALSDFQAGLLIDKIIERVKANPEDAVDLALITTYPESQPNTLHSTRDFTAMIELVIEERQEEYLNAWERDGTFYGESYVTANERDKLIEERRT